MGSAFRIGPATVVAALALWACGRDDAQDDPRPDAARPDAAARDAAPDGAADAGEPLPDPPAPDATPGDAADAGERRADAAVADAAVTDAAADAAAPETPDAAPADDCVAPPAAQGEVVFGEWRGFDAPPCARLDHFAVAAAGQALTLELRGLPGPARVEVADVRDGVLAAAEMPGADGRVEFATAVAGEVRLRVAPAAPVRGHVRYVARLTCRAACDLEASRYPILLVHGAAGTDTYFGVLDYFVGVRHTLEGLGYVVYTPALVPLGASEARAADLAAFIDDVLAETGAAKVHIIGHSQAGIDIRVLLGGLGYGDRVASATSIASPHRGLRLLVAEAGHLVGLRFDEAFMTGEFVERYPEDHTVPRFSWAGATCLALDGACRARWEGEQILPLLAPTYGLLRARHHDDGYEGMNDGLVPISSARWGELLGVLPADHLDQIGQLPGLRAGPFDHLAFFVSEARRLRALERATP